MLEKSSLTIMGAFNTITIETVCPTCQKPALLRIQFKYGATWQYEYRVGEVLRWGKNDRGRQDIKSVRVHGISEDCPNCGSFHEFDISVRDGVIQSVSAVVDPSRDRDASLYDVLED
jgi:hypothetical protein